MMTSFFYHLGNSKDFRSSAPRKRTKIKYTFLSKKSQFHNYQVKDWEEPLLLPPISSSIYIFWLWKKKKQHYTDRLFKTHSLKYANISVSFIPIIIVPESLLGHFIMCQVICFWVMRNMVIVINSLVRSPLPCFFVVLSSFLRSNVVGNILIWVKCSTL